MSCSKFPCTFSSDFLGWLKEECDTSKTKSQRSRARIPSMREPASKERISDSVELCETEISFLHTCNTSITTSQKSRAGIPSIRKSASNETIPDSLEQWDTDVCFLHNQLITTSVRLPKIRKIHHDLNFQFSRSPAKSESWIKPHRQC